MKFNTRKLAAWFTALVLLGYFLPFILLGKTSFFTIGDNLDAPYVYNTVLAQTGNTFNFNPSTPVEPVMNGLPRGVYESGLYFTTTVFAFFTPSTAYIINFILAHLIGFFGMFLLLRRHLLIAENQYTKALALALIFALVPFYSIYGACVPAQAFLLYAFLNLLKDKPSYKTDYLIIALFPVFASGIFVGPFVLATLVVILLFHYFRHKQLSRRYMMGIGLLLVTYAIVNIPLILLTFFNHSFPSSRVEFDMYTLFGASYKWWAIVNFFVTLFETQYHTGTFFAFPIIVAFLAAISIVLANRSKDYTLFYLAASIFIIALVYVSYTFIEAKLGNTIPLLKTFQFNRFYFLLPLIWLVMFAISLREMAAYKILRTFSWILIATQFFIVLGCNTEVKENVKLLLHRQTAEPRASAYFAENLFKQIKEHIGKPQKDYRVASLGMHPNIAQYNGFYTIDSYQQMYDLNYKHQFRKAIEGELAKDEYLTNYFDCWGARCYLFSKELSTEYLYGKVAAKEITAPAFNYDVLKQMGCQYILSSVKINGADSTKILLDSRFEDKDAWWDIYLYKIQ